MKPLRSVEHKGNYGNHWGNLKDHDGIIKFDFDVSDLSKDLHLTLNAYDMDFSDEMKLVLNGKTIDHLDKTGNNGTTAQGFILSGSDLEIGSNELTFTNKNAKWHWGVGQISLSTGPKIDETLTVGGNTSGNYGNHWGNLKDHDGIIKFDFDVSDLSKDLHLTLNAYDMDFSDEMKLVLNGKTIDHLDKTGNNGTTAQGFILSSSDLVTGLNELTFTNKNAKWHWGVGQISLSTGPKIDETLTVGGNASGNYGNHWGNLKDHDGIIKFDFDVSDLSKDLHLTLNAYDMDFSDEMKLVLNGKTIDHLDKTGNNGTTAQAFILSSSDLETGK